MTLTCFMARVLRSRRFNGLDASREGPFHTIKPASSRKTSSNNGQYRALGAGSRRALTATSESLHLTAGGAGSHYCSFSARQIFDLQFRSDDGNFTVDGVDVRDPDFIA